METIAYILVGSILLFILLYWIEILLLLLASYRIKTNNKGIKNLKFQEFNRAWNRFVMRKS